MANFQLFFQSGRAKDLSTPLCMYGGRDSSVGIATCYGLDDPGIESQWGARFSGPAQTGPEVPCTASTVYFSGAEQPERGFDHPRHSVWLRKGFSYSSASALCLTFVLHLGHDCL